MVMTPMLNASLGEFDTKVPDLFCPYSLSYVVAVPHESVSVVFHCLHYCVVNACLEFAETYSVAYDIPGNLR